MKLPTTKIQDMRTQRRFTVEEVVTRNRKAMIADLAWRIEDGWKWTWAIVHAASQDASDARGMVLIQPATEKGKFNVVHYLSADCGADTEFAETTAVMLHMLGVGRSAKDLFESSLKSYTKLIVRELDTKHPVIEPVD